MPSELRIPLLSTLLVGVLALAGCAAGRYPYPEAPRVSAKNVRQLRAMASEDLLCDEDALTVAPGGPRLFGVEGCGRRSDYLLLCAYGHCRFREVGSLEVRARFDLGCEGEVTIAHLGGNAWGVEACDQRATYVAACGAASSCAWVPAPISATVDAVEGIGPSGPASESAPPAGATAEAPSDPAASRPPDTTIETPAERNAEAPTG